MPIYEYQCDACRKRTTLSDPKSMARFMKKMAGETGEDFDEGMMEELDQAAEGTGDEPSD